MAATNYCEDYKHVRKERVTMVGRELDISKRGCLVNGRAARVSINVLRNSRRPYCTEFGIIHVRTRSQRPHTLPVGSIFSISAVDHFERDDLGTAN